MIAVSDDYRGGDQDKPGEGLQHLVRMIGTWKAVLVVRESPAVEAAGGAADWIAVDPKEFVEAISRRLPRRSSARACSRPGFPPRLLSPYQSDMAVHPSMFYGRREALSDVCAAKESYAIFGAATRLARARAGALGPSTS